MLTIKRTFLAAAGLVFALTAPASQAGNRNDGSRSIQLQETASLSGVTLKPGSYTLSWSRERGSEEVRIAIARGRDVLATGNGHWVESAQPSPYEAVVYHPEHETNELAEIRFQNSADAIRVDAGTTRADAHQPSEAAGSNSD